MCRGMETLKHPLCWALIIVLLPAYVSPRLIAVFKLCIALGLWAGQSSVGGQLDTWGCISVYLYLFSVSAFSLALAQLGRARCQGCGSIPGWDIPQGLDPMVPVGHCELRMFCHSVIYQGLAWIFPDLLLL